MRDDVERNYQIVGLTRRRCTVITDTGDGPEDSGISAKDWVGNRAALRPGGLFGYFDGDEQKILRRGLPR